MKRAVAERLAWDLKPAVESLARMSAVTQQDAVDAILACCDTWPGPDEEPS